MVIPEFLVPGDKVAIVSTARKITVAEIEEAIHMLKNWSLQPVIGATIGLSMDQFAGSDGDRANDFQKYLDSPEIKAIWCARGGYGTVRIIDQLDFKQFTKKPKWIIGYSDITVLHAHIHQFDIASIHAAMPIDICQSSAEAKTTLKQLLFGKKVGYELPKNKNNRVGIGQGTLVGGNLSMLYSLCGSNSIVGTTAKILCIEDLDEYLYHVDRMVQNLDRNGLFEGLQGLVVGGMTAMKDNTIPFGQDAQAIILSITEKYNFPVVFDFPMGHIPDNRALVLGAKVRLISEEKGVSLIYDDF